MKRAARSETEFELDDFGPAAAGPAPANEAAVPTQLGGRYQVQAWLGQGGMASVYRTVDAQTGRTLAIKHCSHAPNSRDGRELCRLFEREFYLLAQLSHPRVIEVYDYGIDGGRPYYTMELLDGGDLRELAPLPWRRACALIYDVCSSLALLHSRRFVHRDVSPRNVRCTLAGCAKLIDFGAAMPMGAALHVVGTPPFVAPEALSRVALDARADLFGVGATCYFALTGELPFQAHHLSDLNDAWRVLPLNPSELVGDIPAALDRLVMALLSLDPAQRPPSAFEVMQRLSAIAELPQHESHAVPRAYLAAPSTFGRERELAVLRDKLTQSTAAQTREPSRFTLLVTAASGGGRSHLLDAAALMAKTLGATVLRAGASANARRFAVAQNVLAQLSEHAPRLLLETARTEAVAELLLQAHDDPQVAPQPRALDDNPQPAAISDALARLLWAAGRSSPLLLVVDDVHDLDEASLLFLTKLAQASPAERVSLLLAGDEGAVRSRNVVRVLARYCEALPLPPLDAEATAQLIGSLFGDVANTAFISHEIYQRAHGNPGATLWSAQWLVDRGAIRYESGAWLLPAQLSASDLPLSHEQAVVEHLNQLSPLARELAECQALAVCDVLTRDDFARLAPEHPGQAIEGALLELVSADVLHSDGFSYRLPQQAYAQLLLADDRPQQRKRQHAALARLYLASDAPPVYAVLHLLESGQDHAAIDRLLEHFAQDDAQVGDLAANHRLLLDPDVLADIYMRCLARAEQLQLPPRTLGELRRHVVLVSVIEDEACYRVAAPGWLAQLERDSGLARYRELDPELPALDRLGRAYNDTLARFEQTPAQARGYAPDEAIRLLVHYVIISMPIAVRSLDTELALSLPALLEPFSPISAVVMAIWRNTLSSGDYRLGRRLRARARWSEVGETLERVTGDELRYVTAIRNAIAFAIGTVDVEIGQTDLEAVARRLASDPMQRVNAMYLRKLSALQQGDRDAAEHFRKQAELLAVQDRTQQMFTMLLPIELTTHALAGDLAGLRFVIERIEAVAERYTRWRPMVSCARGLFQLLRGNLQHARSELEDCLAACDPRQADHGPVLPAFGTAAAAYVETLDGLAEHELAVRWGRAALEQMALMQIDLPSWDLMRALALVEAKRPEYSDTARQRLAELLASQRELGARGLRLGLTHEAYTRIAVQAHDLPAALEHARLAAAEYRHGLGSFLGARYEQLRDDARRAGIELPS